MNRPITRMRVRISTPTRTSEEAPEAEMREALFEYVCRHMRKLAGAGAPDYDDLVQAAAERALRDLAQFEGRSSLSTWAFRVCYSTLIDQRRAHKRWLRRLARSHEIEVREVASQHPLPDDRLHWAERNKRLRQALERIGVKRSTVVNLHDLQGVDASEIAELLDINLLTVRSRLRDGRRELARRLQGDAYFGAAPPEPGGHS